MSNCDKGKCGSLCNAACDVEAFKRAHNQPLPDKLFTPDLKRMNLLYDLMLEEFVEVTNSIYLEDGSYKLDHVELADGLADLVYVTLGMALEAGIDLDAVWQEVHSSNMRKIGPDGKFITDERGKIEKPEGWVGPDIKKAIGL